LAVSTWYGDDEFDGTQHRKRWRTCQDEEGSNSKRPPESRQEKAVKSLGGLPFATFFLVKAATQEKKV
jgi:hypothetical protein